MVPSSGDAGDAEGEPRGTSARGERVGWALAKGAASSRAEVVRWRVGRMVAAKLAERKGRKEAPKKGGGKREATSERIWEEGKRERGR